MENEIFDVFATMATSDEQLLGFVVFLAPGGCGLARLAGTLLEALESQTLLVGPKKETQTYKPVN